MTFLHCILRSPSEPRADSWEVYSAPTSIYADGSSREEAEQNFRSAAEFHFGDQWPQIELVVHLEREVAPGVYARTAFDTRGYERAEGAGVLRAALTVPEQYRHLERSAEHANTGDLVVAVCVPQDTMGWLTSQMAATESLLVGVASVANMFWWTALSGYLAPGAEDSAGTLAELGLSRPDATVADLMRSDPVSVEQPRRRRGLRQKRSAPAYHLRGARRLVAAGP